MQLRLFSSQHPYSSYLPTANREFSPAPPKANRPPRTNHGPET